MSEPRGKNRFAGRSCQSNGRRIRDLTLRRFSITMAARMNQRGAPARRILLGVLIAGGAVAASSAAPAAEHAAAHAAAPPAIDAKAAEFVAVEKADDFEKGGVTVMTQAVAVKETGPKETVARFGEVYAFSPSFIAARRERPLVVRFWNLQPDDEHDFALLGPKGQVLAFFKLPPLSETVYAFTFHKDGPYDFKCTIHQPGMSGQILVLPKAPEN